MTTPMLEPNDFTGDEDILMSALPQGLGQSSCLSQINLDYDKQSWTSKLAMNF
jgi:hypothetical protein